MLGSGPAGREGLILSGAFDPVLKARFAAVEVSIRIGEGLATFALLHHRAYGSVHGGSCSLT
jgi:hypothetical protein